MASKLGPRIVTDNLVLALDCADAKSYPGEPTINLSPNSDYSGASLDTINSGSNSGWGTTFDRWISEIEGPGGKTVKAFHLKLTGSTGSAPNAEGEAYEVSGIDSQVASLTSGNSYRVSAWAKVIRANGSSTAQTSSNLLYLTGTASIGSSSLTVNTTWTRISASFSISSTGSYRLRHYFYGVSVGDILVITEPQIELKSYNTPYVYSSRSAITSFLIHGNVGSGTTFEDSSPNKITVSNQNSVSHGGTSNFGGSAIQFSSSSSQQLTSASTDIINFGTGDWTIEFWFNMTSGSTARMHALSCGPGSTNNIDFNFNDGNAFWLYWNSGGSPNIIFGNDGDYGDGNWHHLMATRASGMVRVWVDGVHKGSNNYSSSTSMGQTASIYVGGKNGVYWDGFLDEIRIIKGTALWSGSGDFSVPTERFKNGAWLDISGNENNGNFINELGTGTSHYRVGDVIYPAGTNSARYLEFDGTDQYVTIGHNTSFDNTTFSFSAWVYVDGNTTSDRKIVHLSRASEAGGRAVWQIRTSATSNQLLYQTNNAGTWQTQEYNSFFSGAGWYHVCVTHVQGSAAKMYKNGSFVSVNTGSCTQNFSFGTDPLFIGARNNGTPSSPSFIDFWDGKMAQIMLYSQELSAAEVLDNYNSTKSRFS